MLKTNVKIQLNNSWPFFPLTCLNVGNILARKSEPASEEVKRKGH